MNEPLPQQFYKAHASAGVGHCSVNVKRATLACSEVLQSICRAVLPRVSCPLRAAELIFVVLM